MAEQRERVIAPKHITLAENDHEDIALAAYHLSKVDYKDARSFIQHAVPSSHWSANSKHTIRLSASDATTVRELALHANGSAMMTVCGVEDSEPALRRATEADFREVFSTIYTQVVPAGEGEGEGEGE